MGTLETRPESAPLRADETSQEEERAALKIRYAERQNFLTRVLRPPSPVFHNPSESHLPYVEGLSLWIGAAGQSIPAGFIGVDLIGIGDVHVVADVEALPFASESVSRIECNAVLEHVQRPSQSVSEMFRVLKTGGYLHIVVPFCHPVHLYPGDYNRWTIDGLRELVSEFEVIDVGVRSGPTATLLAVILEYLKLIAPRPLRKPTYAVAGWLLWPLRYIDKILLRRNDAHVLANHIYLLARRN